MIFIIILLYILIHDKEWTMEIFKSIYRFFRKPAVTVIIPVYNVEPYLRECLDSVGCQTLKNIEIICINDASQDGSLRILKKYTKKDKRIRLYNHSQNKGLGYCRNFGISKARADYLFFLDSDDFIKPETLKALYKRITATQADICQYLANIYDNVTHEISLRSSHTFNAVRNSNSETYDYTCNPELIFNNVEAWTKLYRKSFLLENNINFFEGTNFEDTFTHIKSMILAKKICFVDNYYIFYRRNRDGQITGNSENTDKFLDIFNYINATEKFLKENNLWGNLKKKYYKFVMGRICDYYEKCSNVTKVKFAQKAKEWCTNKEMSELEASSPEKFELFCSIVQ